VLQHHRLETPTGTGPPAGAADRSALPIAGDDAHAKAAVAAFLDAIGYDAVDAGPLAEGRRFQPCTPLYGAIYAGGDPDFYNLPPMPAGADLIRRALATAYR
jgi:8-hydroxy-5-deazaflavin:NADPH oxidoreductase